MSFLARGPLIGEVVRDGIKVCENYEWYCLRHPKPIKMLKSLAEEITTTMTKKIKEKKLMIISGAHCPRCGQWLEEGRWLE